MDMQERTVIVTGGASGIGNATAFVPPAKARG
jgi:NAD(P)-dependent dehydrogenase (short-subunit alcohol dehydrogenase family)